LGIFVSGAYVLGLLFEWFRDLLLYRTI